MPISRRSESEETPGGAISEAAARPPPALRVPCAVSSIAWRAPATGARSLRGRPSLRERPPLPSLAAGEGLAAAELQHTQRKKRGSYKKRPSDNLEECCEKLLKSGTDCKKKWSAMAEQGYSSSVSGDSLRHSRHTKSFEVLVCKKSGSADAYAGLSKRLDDLSKSLDDSLEERFEKLLASGTGCKKKWSAMAEQGYSSSASGDSLRHSRHTKPFEVLVCKKLGSKDACAGLSKSLDEVAEKEDIEKLEERFGKLLASGTGCKKKWSAMAEQGYSSSASRAGLRSWWHSKPFEEFVCKRPGSKDACAGLSKSLDEAAEKEEAKQRALRDEEKHLRDEEKQRQKQLEGKERDECSKLTCLGGSGGLKEAKNHQLNKISRLREEVLLPMLQAAKGCGAGPKCKLIGAEPVKDSSKKEILGSIRFQ